MDFAQLKRFIAVVEGGSFGKAADNLSLSQPGLSKSIHQLEAHFGEPLFHRGTKGVTSTELGKAVYRRAKRVLAEWHQLENERAAISGGLTGHITVGVARGTGFLGRVIPAASAKLSQSRYSVRLSVVSGVAEELVPALQLGELDFAIAPLDAIVGKPDLVGEDAVLRSLRAVRRCESSARPRGRGQHRAAHEIQLALFDRRHFLLRCALRARAQPRRGASQDDHQQQFGDLSERRDHRQRLHRHSVDGLGRRSGDRGQAGGGSVEAVAALAGGDGGGRAAHGLSDARRTRICPGSPACCRKKSMRSVPRWGIRWFRGAKP